MTRSYPEPLRVTGPLLSLVLRVEDVWQRYNQHSKALWEFMSLASRSPSLFECCALFSRKLRQWKNESKRATF